METATQTKQAIKGGEFLIRETQAHEIFIPEEFTEEQKMIAQTCKDFLKHCRVGSGTKASVLTSNSATT